MTDGRDEQDERSDETTPSSETGAETGSSDARIGDETPPDDIGSAVGRSEDRSETSGEHGTVQSDDVGEESEPGSSVDETTAGRGSLSPERIEAYTTGRLSLSPDVRVLWGLRTTVTMVILGSILGIVLVNLGLDPIVAPVAVLSLIVFGIVLVLVRYRVWVYQIREDTIYLERGVFRHVRTLVPYVRIQHVDTSRGPLERSLGLSTLVVYTAGSRGADVSIPGLTPEQARDLQQRVKELAIDAEGDDAL